MAQPRQIQIGASFDEKTLEQWKIVRQELRKDSAKQLPNTDFMIKSIRSDERCFFQSYIEMVITPNKKYPLRKGNKKNYTVTGKGVYSRKRDRNDAPLKTPQYTKEEKALFSKAQSASLSTSSHFTTVFRHNKDEALAGIFLERKDFLLSDRNYIYDTGTVNRPYDFDLLADAASYFKKTNKITLFSSAEDDQALFKKAIQDPKNKDKYNEILSRQRWNTDGTSKIFIGSDTLESRLQAQEYARLLKQHLLQQKVGDESYQVPLFFYCPTNPDLNFKSYTPDEQELDRLEASFIYSNQKIKKDKYKNKKYQFLLVLPPEKIKAALLQDEVNGKAIAWHLRNEGYIHILNSLADRLKYSLVQLLEQFMPINGEETLLHVAAKRRDLETVRFLLAAKDTDVNKAANDGITPLYIAAKNGHLEIVKVLLAAKDIDVNKATNDNATPLYFAAENGRLGSVKALLEKGVDVNNKSYSYSFFGTTPLSIAQNYGYHQIVAILKAFENIPPSQPNTEESTREKYLSNLRKRTIEAYEKEDKLSQSTLKNELRNFHELDAVIQKLKKIIAPYQNNQGLKECIASINLIIETAYLIFQETKEETKAIIYLNKYCQNLFPLYNDQLSIKSSSFSLFKNPSLKEKLALIINKIEDPSQQKILER